MIVAPARRSSSKFFTCTRLIGVSRGTRISRFAFPSTSRPRREAKRHSLSPWRVRPRVLLVHGMNDHWRRMDWSAGKRGRSCSEAVRLTPAARRKPFGNSSANDRWAYALSTRALRFRQHEIVE